MAKESLEGRLFNLVEELERTTILTRKFDIEVDQLVSEFRAKEPTGEKLLFSGWLTNGGNQEDASLAHALGAPPYTTSLDTILSIVEEDDLVLVLQRAQQRLMSVPVSNGYKERLIKYTLIEALKTLAFNRLSVTVRSEA